VRDATTQAIGTAFTRRTAMKKKVTKRDRRKPRVKDLTSKDAAKVKGGQVCATGEHIKKAVLEV